MTKQGKDENKPERLKNNPDAILEDWDALLYWVHKRYAQKLEDSGVPDLSSLLVRDIDVIFDDNAKNIMLRSSDSERIAYIVSPPLQSDSKETEEERRIYLLNKFSGSLLILKQQGYELIRKILAPMMDDEGWKIMLEKFQEYKNSLKDCKIA